MQEPALKKAMTTLEILSQSEEARWRYEARQKFLRDQASMLEGAREEGRAEGRAEGKEEVARNLLAMGISVEVIAKATGLSIDQIRALADHNR